MSFHGISICKLYLNFLYSAGRRKAITCKVRNVHDKYGAYIFRSGRATQPKNPYFVAKMRNQLVTKNNYYILI